MIQVCGSAAVPLVAVDGDRAGLAAVPHLGVLDAQIRRSLATYAATASARRCRRCPRGLHVLPGDQGQQRQRRRGPRLQSRACTRPPMRPHRSPAPGQRLLRGRVVPVDPACPPSGWRHGRCTPARLPRRALRPAPAPAHRDPPSLLTVSSSWRPPPGPPPKRTGVQRRPQRPGAEPPGLRGQLHRALDQPPVQVDARIRLRRTPGTTAPPRHAVQDQRQRRSITVASIDLIVAGPGNRPAGSSPAPAGPAAPAVAPSPVRVGLRQLGLELLVKQLMPVQPQEHEQLRPPHRPDHRHAPPARAPPAAATPQDAPYFTPCSQPILHHPPRTGNSTLDYRQPVTRRNSPLLLDRRSREASPRTAEI